MSVGVNANFHRAVGVGLDDGEELEAVAEPARVDDVLLLDLAQALGVELGRWHPEAVGERGENGGLVRGVVAVDVERVVGLGVPEALGFREYVLELEALRVHAREDVVAGAVDDAVDGKDAVGDEALAQRADDGYAAGDAGLEQQVALVLVRDLEEFRAALGQQGLVGGDDVLAALQRELGELERLRGAADELDDDVEVGVGDELAPVGRGELGGHADLLGALGAADGDLVDANLRAGALAQQVGLRLEAFPHAGADGAKSGQADAQDGAICAHVF